jgi:hypothetical protein
MFSQVAAAVPADPRPVCALAVDAEEDFDWDRPLASTQHSTHSMRNINDLQEVVGAYGVRPTYLLTYPILDDDVVIHLLRRQLNRGYCDVGAQLHPWVNPPLSGEGGLGASFSGNLPPGLEEAKLVALKARFIERFGRPPIAYRAGRYGFGYETADLLERHGFEIDTSVAPRTTSYDEGGPDYADFDYELFWFGRERRLLEVPLCRSVVGWGGRLAPPVYRFLSGKTLTRLRVPGIVTRLRFAERITLSPEGNDVGAMLRLIRHLRARGQTVFVISFHSSSLAPGQNPYVRSRADLHEFYDRLSGVLDAMANRLDFRFASLAELPQHLTSR